jgi:hypothetical protein
MESGSAVIRIIVRDGTYDCPARRTDCSAGNGTAAKDFPRHSAGAGADQCAIADSIAGAPDRQQSRPGGQAGCYDSWHCELSYGLPIWKKRFRIGIRSTQV